MLLAPAPAVSGLCPLLSDRRGVSALLTSQAGSAGPGAAVPCLPAACPALRSISPCGGVRRLVSSGLGAGDLSGTAASAVPGCRPGLVLGFYCSRHTFV